MGLEVWGGRGVELETNLDGRRVGRGGWDGEGGRRVARRVGGVGNKP